jgi:6-phosphogluconolactonase
MLLVVPARTRARVWLAALAAAFLILGAGAASALASSGAVYTETNATDGNAVQKFDRAPDGTLTPAGTFATGGTGSSTPGGRQGALTLSEDGDTLYAVNSGSDTVSAFRVTQRGLVLVGSVRSGGIAPVSVDEYHGRVYVVNSGDTPSRGGPNVTEFVAPFGHLVPVPGGTRELAPGAAGIAQVSVAPDGRRLVVTERDANRIETLPLDVLGRPRAPVVTASAGATPFGFDFGRHGELIVSEAGASTVSSYRVGLLGDLSPITPARAVGRGAACWVAVSPNGRFAYTGNAAGSISGFAIDRSGALTPLDADGLTASLPAPFTPRDLAFDRRGRFLYEVSPGGQVAGFRVGRDGALQQITTAPASAGLTGIAVS